MACIESNQLSKNLYCFYNFNGILKYFEEFFDKLTAKSVLNFSDVVLFVKSLSHLEQNNILFSSSNCTETKECYNVLHKIFIVISSEYFQLPSSEKSNESAFSLVSLFDLLSLLLKLLIVEKPKLVCEPLQNILRCLIEYFHDCTKHLKKHDILPVDDEQFHHVLFFLNKLLKSLDHLHFSECFNQETIFGIINSLPLCDRFTLNLFVNQILHILMDRSEYATKQMILTRLWLMIKFDFEESNSKMPEVQLFALLHAIFDYVFIKEIELISLSDNILFEIIQAGLTSSSSVVRRQAISVFKMLLFWVKTKRFINHHNKSLMFCLKSESNIFVWEDLITLFEVFEEKQVHVIKPVLPKFSRILLVTFKKDSVQSDDDILHPSWVTCLITRMLQHESKSIVKEGIYFAMNLNFDEYNVEFLCSERFLHLFLEAIDDQNMYCRMQENKDLCFLSSQKLSTFLNSFVSAFNTEKEQASFLRILLRCISYRSWGCVALMHFTFALSKFEPINAWKIDDIKHIRNILEVSLKSFESTVRNAVENWMLRALLNLLDWKEIGFIDLMEILFTFKHLHRHSVEWEQTIGKLQKILSSSNYVLLSIHESKLFCINNIEKILKHNCELEFLELEKFVRLLLVLADCSIINPFDQESNLSWISLLHPISVTLMDAPKRPYLSRQMFNRTLKFYMTLTVECQSYNNVVNDAHVKSIITSLNCTSDFIEFIFEKCLISLNTVDDVINFQTLSDAFKVFSSLNDNFDFFSKQLPYFIVKCKKMQSDILSRNTLIVLLYATFNSHLKRLQLSEVSISTSMNELSFILLSQILQEQIIENLSKHRSLDKILNDALKELTSKYVTMFWETTSYVIGCIPSIMLESIANILIQQILKSLDGGPRSSIFSCINCIHSLILKHYVCSSSIVKDIINSVWAAVSELHGTEAFRPAFSSFVYLLCQPNLMHENCAEFFFGHINTILENTETSLGTFYVLIKHMCSNFDQKHLAAFSDNVVPVLTRALTYGPIHRKSQQMLENTITYFQDQDHTTVATDFNKPSFHVRVVSVIYLMKLLKEKCAENEDISLTIINSLLDLDTCTRNTKSSKFSNSYCHRLRNRIWQSVLFLQLNLVDPEKQKLLFSNILGILENDNQQTSVRYLEEWVIFNILFKCKNLIVKFISHLETSHSMRPGFLISLLSVLYHLINCDLIDNEEIVSKCFIILIYFSMAQNFTVRLYARLVLSKLFLLCKSKKFSLITEKFNFLSASVLQTKEDSNSDKGNIYKNLVKLSEDFYFCNFSPIRHFTIETIFYELPRLSNLSSEEWIEPKHFYDEVKSEPILLPFFNTDELLKNSVAILWMNKETDEPRETYHNSKSDSFDFNFQKKISPLKPDPTKQAFDSIEFVNEIHPKSQLIVIASLIDRIPNLGGLCRTCEIFGVGQFVIGSLKYVEDKQFQSLAVSADKWMSIKEIKPYHLKEYLLSLKEDGYTLVGAEQTDNSQKLDTFVFPKKSALLLGHEKEGLPVDFIQLLDVCVEIQQMGVIRSLNVHVSGALFIWEYLKQHMGKKSLHIKSS